MLNFSTKKFISFIFIFLIAFVGYKIFAFFSVPRESFNFSEARKKILVDDNGFVFEADSPAKTVEEFLEENKIVLGDYDNIFPKKDSTLSNGSKISIKRAVKINIKADGKTAEVHTLQNKVIFAILESGIELGPLDEIDPEKNYVPRENMLVSVTRINVEEKSVSEEINFKTITKTDDDMGWREEKIEQAGENGTREVLYKITYENGKEVSRIILENNVIKEPVSKIVTRGTYVKLGKTHRGQGTWYSFMGGMYAANPWLPMGSYVKVTNQDNGKSVIVQINDRGPFGNGRIIDLDKVAFQKIASLGAGVINVKMEEILN